MNPNKALWEKGDFTRIAATMRDSGEALVKSLEIANGTKVLDLGCGDGTTAVPTAKLGANVLGIDIARNLVEAGNRRAREQRLSNHGSRKAMRRNLRASRTTRSTWLSAFSVPCLRQSLSTPLARWCA